MPTEAEWEFACRAGTTTPFSFGRTLSTGLANYNGNATYADGSKGEYREKTVPVASFPPNGWGLFEMHGNVWEWCEDWYETDYYKGRPDPDKDPTGPLAGQYRVLRGGSWFYNPWHLRSANRSGCDPESVDFNYGFRAAWAL